MAEFGAIRFDTADEPDDLRRTIEVLWEQKKRIFARKGIGDMFARPGYREFFADSPANPSSRHLAHVSRLVVGWAAWTANFAILFGDCYYHVLSSYWAATARFGPGTVHLRELLAHAIRLGLRLFDFTIGDEHYKLEWSDLRLTLYDYSTAATLRGWPACAPRSRGGAQALHQTDAGALALVWRMRSVMGPLLQRVCRPFDNPARR